MKERAIKANWNVILVIWPLYTKCLMKFLEPSINIWGQFWAGSLHITLVIFIASRHRRASSSEIVIPSFIVQIAWLGHLHSCRLNIITLSVYCNSSIPRMQPGAPISHCMTTNNIFICTMWLWVIHNIATRPLFGWLIVTVWWSNHRMGDYFTVRMIKLPAQMGHTNGE